MKKLKYDVIIDEISFLKSSKRFDFLGNLIKRDDTHKKNVKFYSKVFISKHPEMFYEKIKHIENILSISEITTVHDYADSDRYLFLGGNDEALEYQLAIHLAKKYNLI